MKTCNSTVAGTVQTGPQFERLDTEWLETDKAISGVWFSSACRPLWMSQPPYNSNLTLKRNTSIFKCFYFKEEPNLDKNVSFLSVFHHHAALNDHKLRPTGSNI
ncbi:Hypothetical predicted protein [Xyrichtys novacula]|uniref:Uncharacterized protein n=1 Tax=Xyrichtys novacula TaxID=13765 RepID=A0AAV1FFT5_XYRNO|nr:Hypothetical predicted protein [Xyrichtys novacula]